MKHAAFIVLYALSLAVTAGTVCAAELPGAGAAEAVETLELGGGWYGKAIVLTVIFIFAVGAMIWQVLKQRGFPRRINLDGDFGQVVWRRQLDRNNSLVVVRMHGRDLLLASGQQGVRLLKTWESQSPPAPGGPE